MSKILLATTLLCLFAFVPTSFAVPQDPVPTLAPPSTFGSATAPPSSSAASSLSSAGNSSVSATQTSTAQFPSLSGVSTCVSTCLSLSIAESNCTSVVAVNCFCSNATFPALMVNCVNSGCASELSNAETLAQRFCNVATSSTSLSFPLPTSSAISSSRGPSSSGPSSSGSSLSSSTPAGSSSTAPPTSAAPPTFWISGFTLWVGAVGTILVGSPGSLL
ncbi:hypothetical protein BD779DRAFT_1674619 [Infundibulicybe gibba]|nr:hypothetical protein BD779DRAFT_1674619 [Infundibulicybe gibba]